MRIHLDYLLTVPLINTQGLPLNLQACEVQYTGGVSASWQETHPHMGLLRRSCIKDFTGVGARVQKPSKDVKVP